MDRQRDITGKIRDIPPVRLPGDFTHVVMRRIYAEQKKSLFVRLRDALPFQKWDVELRAALTKNVTDTECTLSFLVTGLFYMIMGAILILGLSGFEPNVAITKLIRFQSQITIVTAVLLVILGILLVLDGESSIKIVKFGTLLYISMAVVNGLVLQMAFIIPISDAFTVIFTGTGILMGTFLAVKIENYQKGFPQKRGSDDKILQA